MKSLHVTHLGFVGLRFVVSLVVVVALGLSPWSPAASAPPTASAAEMPIGATLLVLAAPVEVQFSQTDSFAAAFDGQMLSQGDVVRTGPGGLALLTFFDGSESQLGAETEIQLERVEATPAPQIAFLQTAGVTMNHVVPMPPGGSFRTDTPAASGLVRGTSYVVVVGAEASAVPDDAAAAQPELLCGVGRDGSCATSVILLTDRDGHVGRVDVAASGLAASEPLRLANAGDAAASDAGQTAGAKVALPTLQALEAAANARNVPEAAHAAEHHARIVAAALVPLTKAASVNGHPADTDGPGPLAHADGPVAHTESPLVAHSESPLVAHSDTPLVAHSESPLVAHTDESPVAHGEAPEAVPVPAEQVHTVEHHDPAPMPTVTPGHTATPPSSTHPGGSTPTSTNNSGHAAPVSTPALASATPGRVDTHQTTNSQGGQSTPAPVPVPGLPPPPPTPAPVTHALPVTSAPTAATVKPDKPAKPDDQSQS